MTIKFLEEFRARSKCSQCKAAPAEGRKTCEKHLERAKLQWRMWCKRRIQKRLCIACDRRPYQGELRCLLHKGQNQAKCRAWVKANSDWCSFRAAFEALFLKLDRICIKCRRRPMAARSTRSCSRCLSRAVEHDRAWRLAARAA